MWAKVNVLLYAGEDSETLAETREWLEAHEDCIKGVSVGPVVAYGPPVQARTLIMALEAQGARAVDAGSAATTGVTAIHPSPTMDADAAEEASLELSRRFMDQADYFDLKSFSYYPRGYSPGDFQADLAEANADCLPFRVA